MKLASYATPVERVFYWGTWIFTAAVLLFLIAPILVIMPLSFNAEPYFTYPMPGLSLQWYQDFFMGDRWMPALWVSVKIAVAVTILSTILGTLAALGLSRTNLPLRSLMLGTLISPMIVPVIISAVAMYFFYARLGMIGWISGIILAHTVLATPFVVVTVTSTLAGFDWTLARAGTSLGASPFTVFRKIIMPLILPGMISGALFAFVTSFDEVVVALFLADPETRTLPKQMFSGIREQISPTITAAATVLIIFSTLMLVGAELMRRRSERLRGITR